MIQSFNNSILLWNVWSCSLHLDSIVFAINLEYNRYIFSSIVTMDNLDNSSNLFFNKDFEFQKFRKNFFLWFDNIDCRPSIFIINERNEISSSTEWVLIYWATYIRMYNFQKFDNSFGIFFGERLSMLFSFNTDFTERKIIIICNL